MMSNGQQVLIGIQAAIEDEATGVPVAFHTLTEMRLDFNNNYHTVTVGSYFSRQTFERGRYPVGYGRTVRLDGTPPRGADHIDWALQSLLTAEGSPFAGGEAVYGDAPEPAETAAAQEVPSETEDGTETDDADGRDGETSGGEEP